MFIKRVQADNVSVNLIPPEVLPDLKENFYTIIVGANGGGKSRILEAIAACGMMFQLLGKEHESCKFSFEMFSPLHCLRDARFKKIEIDFLTTEEDKVNTISAEKLTYEFSGFVQRTENETPQSGNVILFGDYIKHGEIDGVICISNAVFDRFPSVADDNVYSRELLGYYNLSVSENVKLCRGSYGQYSAVNMLSKEILSTFFSDQVSFVKGIDFLKSFGFTDKVVISLQLNRDVSGIGFNGIDNRDELLQSLEMRQILDKEKLTPEIEMLIDTTMRELMKDFSEKDKTIFGDAPTTFWLKPGIKKYELDVNSIVELQIFKNIKILSDLNIIQIKDVVFTKCDGRECKLNDMSSGETNVLLTLFKINSRLEDNTIVLVDEPEISLHPEWQGKILPSLEKTFKKYRGCHFIIATHSPQVVASIPEMNSSVVILGGDNQPYEGRELRGRSADFQLFSVLGYLGDENEYLIRQLITIIAKLSENESLSLGERTILQQADLLLEKKETSEDIRFLLLQAQKLDRSFEDE